MLAECELGKHRTNGVQTGVFDLVDDVKIAGEIPPVSVEDLSCVDV